MVWHTNTAILARLESYSAETAWTTLTEYFERPLTSYAHRSGLAPSAVPDVVQETLVAFAEAYRRGAYDRTRGRLSSWLFGIARREVAAAKRRAALDPIEALDSSSERDYADEDDSQERIWEVEWRRAVLERCIECVRQEVEPSTWECFALQSFNGLGADAVAETLGLPRTRVYNAKYRVSRRLRQLAEEFEDV